MMNAIFEDEIREGWLTVYMDGHANCDPLMTRCSTESVSTRILDKLGKTRLVPQA